MPVISDSSETEEVDELTYESEPKSNGKYSDEESEEVRPAAILCIQDAASMGESLGEEDELAEDEDEYDSKPGAKKGRSTPSQSAKKAKAPLSATKQKKLAKPKGGKLIYFDSVNIPKGDATQIDKFVHSRVDDNGSIELLTKYKNMSYLSARWIPISELEKDKNVRSRVSRFLEKSASDTQWSEEEAFNPAYGQIDRVIDEGDLDGELHYLVKWCALSYDCCTWENHKLVEKLDSDKIDEFHRRSIMTDDRIVSYTSGGRNAPIGKWRKLTESPKFKDDNTLRSYQLEGLNWLMYCWHNKQSSILADEMGLGKTVQSTAFLYQLFRTQNIKGPFLVVVPLSTMGNWEREMKTWTEMNVIVYHGNQTARNLLVETEFYFRDAKGNLDPSMFKFDVLLTTYEMAMAGAAQLRPIHWRAGVLDEAHKLKNKNAKITEFLKAYDLEHKVLLTGTPLQNSLDELWALLNFLEPERFHSDKEFLYTYGSMTTADDVQKLQLLIKPLMLRRLKEDVEKSIPIKEETIVEVELTTTQKKWYRSILEKNFAWLKQGTKKSNVPQLVNTMIELRKCCIHPWLLNGAEEQILTELNTGDSMDLQMKALVQSSGKMVLIDKLLTKLKAGGHKVLVFSQMTKCLDLIQEYIRHKNWQFERIDGGIRGEFRQAAIDRFSAPGSESFIFLLCTKAGGVGINLTAADTCIIFDSDWNPQNDLQAQSRIHRIGQKKSVKIYRLITRNTYEREMFDRASMKLGLDKALLQRSTDADPFDSKNKASGSLSKQEVEDLLKKGAYGAFMDDGAGDKFCEEDIEQILERRTMVIRHDEDAEARKGSMFSKASFQAEGSSAAVDVNDPDFWDKVAEQAKLEVVDELPEENLIIDAPRARKQTNRLFDGQGEIDEDPSEDFKLFRPSESKAWTTTERNRLERTVMQLGFYNWEKMAESFPRRSPEHLKAVVRALLLKCIELCPQADEETVADVKRAIAIFYPPVSSPDGENAAENKPSDGLPEPVLAEVPDEDLPWRGADPKEIIPQIAEPEPSNEEDLKADENGENADDEDLEKDENMDDDEMDLDQPPENETLLDKAPEAEAVVKEETATETVAVAAEVAPVENGTAAANGAVPEAIYVPSPTELGLRIRKILSGLARYRASLGKDEKDGEKKRMVKEYKRNAKESDMSKKARLDFQKALLSFGVERRDDGTYKWDNFKIIAELTRKTDEALSTYIEKLIELSHRTNAYCEKIGAKKGGTTDTDASIVQVMAHPDYPKTDDGESISWDRAKKVIKRIEIFDRLRLSVLMMPDLEVRFANIAQHGKAALPKWWDYSYDIPFLKGVARFGYTQSEAFIRADDLPFKTLHEDFLRSLEERKETQVPSHMLMYGKFEEKFWMRDSVALKRLELLIDVAEKPAKTKTPKKTGRPKGPTEKLPKLKFKVSQGEPATESSAIISDAASFAPAQAYHTNGHIDAPSSKRSDSEDTDEMLAAASKLVNQVKKKRKPKKLAYPPIQTAREEDVAHQLQQLQSQYVEFPEARLPSLASMIPESHPPVYEEVSYMDYREEYRPEPTRSSYQAAPETYMYGYPAQGGHAQPPAGRYDPAPAAFAPETQLAPLQPSVSQESLPGIHKLVSALEHPSSSPPLKRPLSEDERDQFFHEKRLREDQ
ncbi:choline dehydrogenase 7 [Kappamyces sp. JEL0680]|nr:choline dehydrogenase 7 [Kappamyces sp. JEL0680]